MKSTYTVGARIIASLLAFVSLFPVSAQDTETKLAPSPVNDTEIYSGLVGFSAFSLAQLKAIKAAPLVYHYTVTQTNPGQKHGGDMELEISVPEPLEIDPQGKAVKVVVQVKTKGKVDEVFPSAFTITMTDKSVSTNAPTEKADLVASFMDLLFCDYLDAKAYPDAGFRDFKAGDMMPVLTMFGFSSQIGPLKFVKADGALLEFEALPAWVGRVPKLPQFIESDYTKPRFDRVFVGKVVISKDTFLIHHLDVKLSPAKPGDNPEEPEVSLKLIKK